MSSYAPRYRHNLRNARLEKHLTQKQAAEAVGVSRRTWMAWEYGVRTPSLENAQRVSKLLQYPIEYLFSL